MSEVQASAVRPGTVFDLPWAQRVDNDLRNAVADYDNASGRILRFIDEAQAGSAWSLLGFASWTAYAADVWSGASVKLAAPERRELVAELSSRGMSTRAISPIVGVSHMQVANDIRERGVKNFTPAPVEAEGFHVNPSTGEILDAETVRAALGDEVADAYAKVSWEKPAPDEVVEHTVSEKVKTVTGLDGKTYKAPEQKAPRRRAITEQARDLGWEIRKQAEKLQRLIADDRLSRNKEEVAAHMRGHLMFAVEVCQDLLDTLER